MCLAENRVVEGHVVLPISQTVPSSHLPIVQAVVECPTGSTVSITSFPTLEKIALRPSTSYEPQSCY